MIDDVVWEFELLIVVFSVRGIIIFENFLVRIFMVFLVVVVREKILNLIMFFLGFLFVFLK